MRVPVKINLGLNVLRKREDGFHDLETLFLPCGAFGDELEIEPAEKTSLTLVGKGIDWRPEEDLTYRAWEILKKDFPELGSVCMVLKKGTPVGAGLGGGSADAAFALRELNRIGALGLTDGELADYAARLGSDCAFFIYNRPMIGEGRGEILSPYDIKLPYDVRVEVPEGVSVSTREAYAGILAAKKSGGLPLREALARPVDEWREVLRNDFEETVFPLHPEIPALKKRMYDDGAVYAAMSGSGSAVFGLFRR